MKRINKYISLTLLLITAALAVGCNKEPDPTPSDGRYVIAFDEVTTKAIITNENLTSFKVWGETTEGAADVFKGVEVTGTEPNENGLMTKWSYYKNEADAKYWVENTTYNFFAVAPTSLELSYDSDNGYGIAYKVSDNMAADPVDMVVASAQRQIETLGTKPDDVQLTFAHKLSKVQVQLAKSDSNSGQTIKVKEVYLYGMKGDGVYYYDTGWSLGTDAATVARTNITTELSTSSYVGFGEFLMIPQNLDQESVYLIVSFEYTSNDVTTARVQIAPVPVDVVSKWDANKSYIYKAEISVDQEMIFETPSIENWISNNEGGTIIIK